MNKVGICTLGCKVNTYESEYIESLLKNHGYEIGNFNDKNDIYIINTCSVTNSADSKSRKMIHRALKNNKDAIIIAMGCFIEANHDFNVDGVSIIIGNKDKANILDLIEKYKKEKKQIVNLYKDFDREFEDMEVTTFGSRARAFVKIQDGCENFCSYCIIPYTRGKCRSKDKEKVIQEIKELVKNGYKEVVLTGIHTGHYGIDKNYTFASLLKEIEQIKGLLRLRISSIEITELDDAFLDVLRNSKVIVDHMHIPLQSGTDEILEVMNRKYDTKYYEEKIKKIRAIRPDMAISTDIIVGMPYETEELFQKTIDFAKKMKFSKIHVFPYSKRKGTKASEMQHQVEESVKKRRSRRLIEVSKELEIEYMNRFLNQEMDVIVELEKEEYSIGHTGNFLHVKIPKKLPKDTVVKVKLVKEEYPYLIGEEQ